MGLDDPIEPIHAVPPSPPERAAGPRWNPFQGVARYLRYRTILERRRRRNLRDSPSGPSGNGESPGFDRKA